MHKPTLLALTSLLTLASLASPAPLSTTGTLTTLTLNVAGLPAILNGNGSGDKRANSILIGQKLATYAFDVVNLQEVSFPCTSLPSVPETDAWVRTSTTTRTSMRRTRTPIARRRRAGCRSALG